MTTDELIAELPAVACMAVTLAAFAAPFIAWVVWRRKGAAALSPTKQRSRLARTRGETRPRARDWTGEELSDHGFRATRNPYRLLRWLGGVQ
jgi:hypothetical protein